MTIFKQCIYLFTRRLYYLAYTLYLSIYPYSLIYYSVIKFELSMPLPYTILKHTLEEASVKTLFYVKTKCRLLINVIFRYGGSSFINWTLWIIFSGLFNRHLLIINGYILIFIRVSTTLTCFTHCYYSIFNKLYTYFL